MIEVIDSVPTNEQIVAVMIGGVISNSREAVIKAMMLITQGSKEVDLLDRQRMQFMAAADLGPRWTDLAAGPTFFGWTKNGPVLVKGGVWRPKEKKDGESKKKVAVAPKARYCRKP